MLRTGLTALAVIMSLGVLVEEASAFGHRHRWGSSGGSWGSSGGRWGSSGGSWGSSGGWGYSYYGSSGGSWGSSGGSWGSSGGYYYGSSGGSSGGAYRPVAPAPSTHPSHPTQPATPPTPPAPADAGASTSYHPTYGPMRNSALLTVNVPADAKIFVNDRPTTSTGAQREYISRDLKPGASYRYQVRAEFVRDGKNVSEERTVQLSAGQNRSLSFAGDNEVQTADSGDTRTTLIIRLPKDAKLFLAGKQMKATGEVREFSTNRLAAGAEWTTYAVRAVVDHDGHQEVREQNVTLKAGETRELSLNFDVPQVADAR